MLVALSGVSRFHRFLLIIATIGIGVAASRVAADASESPSWLLLGGCGLMLAAADVLREVEVAATQLSVASQVDITRTRADVLRTKRPLVVAIVLVLGICLALAALVGYATANDGPGSPTQKQPQRTAQMRPTWQPGSSTSRRAVPRHTRGFAPPSTDSRGLDTEVQRVSLLFD